MARRGLAAAAGIAAAWLALASQTATARPGPAARRPAPISLAGIWSCRLDPGDEGVAGRWWAEPMPLAVRLPGSLDQNGVGEPNPAKPDMQRLWRPLVYTGPAWYRRSIHIPAHWAGKRVALHLERAHWATAVWVDGQPAGAGESLCVPHEMDLTALAPPGRHTLTLRVDNRMIVNVGAWAHSVTDETQTNWNGVIGRIELRATDPVWLEAAHAYPEHETGALRARVRVGNATGRPVEARLAVAATPETGGAPRIDAEAGGTVPAGGGWLEARFRDARALPRWDEFEPRRCRLQVELTADAAGRECRDALATSFGIRDLRVGPDQRIRLNGRAILLRGTLECCIFPRTGFPPTDRSPWERICAIARAYGLNHLRFHSWCPPEAAFEAADRAGMLLQVELPQWVADVGKDPPRDAFIARELERILDAYGNHPSFAMLCMGNELQGDTEFLQGLVRKGQEADPRRLYTSSTAWSFGPADDFNVGVVRGVRGPATDHDFRDQLAQALAPVVSHEIGQWFVFPALREIGKYTGVLRARNFDLVRDALRARGMLEQAGAFTRVSGRQALALYKEEIEVLLRTPGSAGFQLLDLHDFPGQGTSLVGMLDAFWDSKGIVRPAEWRRFCSATVPLARLPKRVYTTGETLSARVECAHVGPHDLRGVVATWRLREPGGGTVAQGSFPPADLPTGERTPIGAIAAPLGAVRAPARLRLEVELPGGAGANDWDVWVYPERAEQPAPQGVVVRDAWDEAARAALREGRTVLLLARRDALKASRRSSFLPVFWNTVLFPGQNGTLSVLCDPRHPALARFPTDEHTDWQWHEILDRSRLTVMDTLPQDLRPIVQVVDNPVRNDRLGAVWEATVGRGRLIVCSLDIWSDLGRRPAARQLRESLLRYAAGPPAGRPVALADADLAKVLRDASDRPASLRGDPPVAGARLRVEAAALEPAFQTPGPWRPEADRVVEKAPGFDVRVEGSTWRDATDSTWHASGELAIVVRCPAGFVGTVWLRLWDWNRQGRVTELFVEGRPLAEMDAFEEPVWVAADVTASDTADGEVRLVARPIRGNAHVTDLVVTERVR